MESARDHFFPAARFAGNQHIRIRGSDTRDHVKYRPHGRSLSDHGGQIIAAEELILSLQALAAAECFAELELRVHDGREPLVFPWLLDEIARATAHGFNSQADATPG